MKKEDIIKAIPTYESLYILYSEYTKCPYVVCDEETMDDKVLIFMNEDDAKMTSDSLREKKINTAVIHLDSKELILRTFTSFFVLGVNAVEFRDGDENVLLELGEFIRRPTFDSLPVEQRPIENPILCLTTIYFLQELKRGVDDAASPQMRALEEEMVSNLFKARFIFPGREISDDGGNTSFQPLVLPSGDEKFVIPIFTDEIERARGPQMGKDIKLNVLTMENLLQVTLPENMIGFVINPFGYNLPVTKDWLSRVKVRDAATEERPMRPDELVQEMINNPQMTSESPENA